MRVILVRIRLEIRLDDRFCPSEVPKRTRRPDVDVFTRVGGHRGKLSEPQKGMHIHVAAPGRLPLLFFSSSHTHRGLYPWLVRQIEPTALIPSPFINFSAIVCLPLVFSRYSVFHHSRVVGEDTLLAPDGPTAPKNCNIKHVMPILPHGLISGILCNCLALACIWRFCRVFQTELDAIFQSLPRKRLSKDQYLRIY